MNTILKLALAATLVTAVPLTSHAQSSTPTTQSHTGPSATKVAAKQAERAKMKAMAKREKAQSYKAKRYADIKSDRIDRAQMDRDITVAKRNALRAALQAEKKANKHGTVSSRQERLQAKTTKAEGDVGYRRGLSARGATEKRGKVTAKTNQRNPHSATANSGYNS